MPSPAPPRTSKYTGAGAGSGLGKWVALVGMVAFCAAAFATAWFTLRPAATANAHQTPVVLAPVAPTSGLPTSLETIVRIQAESARHIALQTVERVGSGDTTALASAQPGYRWLAGNEPSTDAHTISVAQNAGVVTIAVAASNHDVCTFGQWSPATSTAQYVTMGHEPTCAAVDAPSAGWSGQAGGAASDLPDDYG